MPYICTQTLQLAPGWPGAPGPGWFGGGETPLSGLDNGEEQVEHQAGWRHLLDPENCPLMWVIDGCSETKGTFGVQKVLNANSHLVQQWNPDVTRGESPMPAMDGLQGFWCNFKVQSKATCQAFCQWIGHIISNCSKLKLQVVPSVWKYFCFQQIYFDFLIPKWKYLYLFNICCWSGSWGFFFLIQRQHFSCGKKKQHSLV